MREDYIFIDLLIVRKVKTIFKLYLCIYLFIYLCKLYSRLTQHGELNTAIGVGNDYRKYWPWLLSPP